MLKIDRCLFCFVFLFPRHFFASSLDYVETRKMLLTRFRPVFHFYAPWNFQKTRGFLIISGGIEREHWLEMSLLCFNICSQVNLFTCYNRSLVRWSEWSEQGKTKQMNFLHPRDSSSFSGLFRTQRNIKGGVFYQNN